MPLAFDTDPRLAKHVVITMISNIMRYDSRYTLFLQWKAHMQECGIEPFVVEVAFGNRPFAVTDSTRPQDIQLRIEGFGSELWHKENAIEIGVQHITRVQPNWETLTVCDADIEFPNHVGMKKANWILETIEQLNHYMIVQNFVNAIDLGPDGAVMQTHTGFGFQYAMGRPQGIGKGYTFWHPGFCWSYRREVVDAGAYVGNLAFCVLGSGDHHAAQAWVGQVDRSIHKGASGPYFDKLRAFQNLCEKYVRRSVGFVPGTIFHYYHGSKKRRFYVERWQVLTDNKFDPGWDLSRNAYGLYTLVDHGDKRSIKMRDDFMAYFRSRQEDSYDVADLP